MGFEAGQRHRRICVASLSPLPGLVHPCDVTTRGLRRGLNSSAASRLQLADFAPPIAVRLEIEAVLPAKTAVELLVRSFPLK